MQSWNEWEQAKAEGYEPQTARYLVFGDGKKSSASAKAKAKPDEFARGYKAARAELGEEDDDYDEEQPSMLESLRSRSEERKDAKESQFSFFDKTIQAAKAEGALDGGIDSQLTVFAPDDSAFRNLSAANRKMLEQEETAATFVKGHIIEGSLDPEHVQGSPEMYASGSVASTSAQTVYDGLSITVIPPRVSQKDLPGGMAAEEPIVQLVDDDTGKILHQANIKFATPIPGRGVIYEIDDVLVPRNG